MAHASSAHGTGGEHDKRLARILAAAGVPGLLDALTTRLSPTDLQTLLLEVARRRAAAVTPAQVLAAYERNRFTTPSALPAGELARLEALVHERLDAHGFTGLALSPLAPLGAHSAVATVDQNKVVTTVRTSEVLADSTNVLALECALRRRAQGGGRARVRLGATGRMVRAQALAAPGMAAHFALLGLCTAGRDEGSFRFETATLREHLRLHLDLLAAARGLGIRLAGVRVGLTDLTGGVHRAALRDAVLGPLAEEHPRVDFSFDDGRAHGRGYYTGACFELHGTPPGGAEFAFADGGFVTWTAGLLSNAKERLLISGLGLERLAAGFREDPAHPPNSAPHEAT
ncbi:hypothetical protein [Streptomyces hoynatensis]|uniref:Uncharacterized protein n=1 Tax=Streptomyces hoynatensis TaxID=1141874 RepID=A0A3A9YMT1_9ACTN|nr:hypothetical protein [Streptomyces hoynatensis]RKN37535.1 hypothetical protein D7294_27755 [Streptomyces hoynatensis]